MVKEVESQFNPGDVDLHAKSWLVSLSPRTLANIH